MQIQYSVRPFDDEIKAAYVRLLPHQAEVIAAGKLEWKYQDNPAAPGLVAVAAADGTIVGMIGSVPARVRRSNRTGLFLQAIDTVVDPLARGRGCFVKMGAELQSAAARLGFDGLFGFPNHNAAPGWFGKLEWSNLGRVPFLFKPLRAGYFLRRWLPSAIDFPVGFPRRSTGPVRIVEAFDDRFDELWRRIAGDATHGVERTQDFLAWRLLRAPAATYRILGRFDGDELRAFVVTRSADKHGGRIGYIMEAIGDETLPELVDEAVARLRDDGVEAVLAWCFDFSPNRRAFSAAGFWPLPRQFAPEIHFGGRAMTGAGAIGARSSWYVSYLDSDTV